MSSPDYGLSMFLWGQPATTDRDLKIATGANFHWQKTLFQWRAIEGAAKGVFDWTESDRVVKASTANGIKIIARIDFQPDWARKDRANNGPPDNYQDYADFISAFAERYEPGSSRRDRRRDRGLERSQPESRVGQSGHQPAAGRRLRPPADAGLPRGPRGQPEIVIITAGSVADRRAHRRRLATTPSTCSGCSTRASRAA